MNLKFLITFSLITTLGVCHAQFKIPGSNVKGAVDAKKAEKRMKQMEESPARDEIKKVEKCLEDNENHYRYESFWKEATPATFKEVEQGLTDAEALLPVIKQKDPKWAEKNDYATELANYKTKLKAIYEEKKPVWEKAEAEEWIYTKRDESERFFSRGGSNYLGNQYTTITYILIYTNFKNKMAGFDYHGTKARMIEIGKKYPDLASSEKYVGLKGFFDKDFPDFLKGNALEFINEDIQPEAIKKFEQSPTMCYEAVVDAENYIADVLALFPDISGYKDAQMKVKTLKTQFEEFMNKNIYTSEFHKTHVDQLLFSNKPIVIGKEKEEDFKTTFKAGEPIYAVRYFSKVDMATQSLFLTINGDSKFQGNFNASQYGKPTVMASYITFPVIPDPTIDHERITGSDYEAYKISSHILAHLRSNKAAFGDKKIKVGINNKEGNFEIDYSAGISEFEAMFKKIEQKRAAGIRLPKGSPASADVVALFKQALLETGETASDVRMYGGWVYEKHPLTGVIVGRTITVWGVVKQKDGQCIMFGGDLTQSKGDGGAYGKPYIKSTSTYENIDGNIYTIDWDGVNRSWGKDGYKCDCGTVGK